MKGIRFTRQIILTCKCGEPIIKYRKVDNPACFECKRVRKLKASKEYARLR